MELLVHQQGARTRRISRLNFDTHVCDLCTSAFENLGKEVFKSRTPLQRSSNNSTATAV